MVQLSENATSTCNLKMLIWQSKTLTDVVIGAPYEDKGGAIYIYLAGPNGFKYKPTTAYWQRILASEFSFSAPLSGFGISISSADIDMNDYPDLVVGSYLSNDAVVLRTQPIIEMSTSMSTFPSTIDPLIGSTAVQICTSYTSRSEFPEKICATYTVHADYRNPNPRVTSEVDRKNISRPWTYDQLQTKGVTSCRNVTIYLTVKLVCFLMQLLDINFLK